MLVLACVALGVARGADHIQHERKRLELDVAVVCDGNSDHLAALENGHLLRNHSIDRAAVNNARVIYALAVLFRHYGVNLEIALDFVGR